MVKGCIGTLSTTKDLILANIHGPEVILIWAVLKNIYIYEQTMEQ